MSELAKGRDYDCRSALQFGSGGTPSEPTRTAFPFCIIVLGTHGAIGPVIASENLCRARLAC